MYSHGNSCEQTWQGNFRVAEVKLNSIMSTKLKLYRLYRIYILLQVLVCSLAEYFNELCRFFTIQNNQQSK